MSDIVYIRGLVVRAIIGIEQREREEPQPIRVDVEMAADTAKAAATESIDDALNYRSVAKAIKAHIEAHPYQLVETLAERLAALIREEFGVPWVRLRVGKPGAVRFSEEVGVVIEARIAAMSTNRAWIVLGSNIDADRWVPWARGALHDRFRPLAPSRLVHGPAEGPSGQAPFTNAAFRFDTDLAYRSLRAVLRDLEWRAGRRRTADAYAPRTLDLDVIHVARLECAAPIASLHLDTVALGHAHVALPLGELWQPVPGAAAAWGAVRDAADAHDGPALRAWPA